MPVREYEEHCHRDTAISIYQCTYVAAPVYELAAQKDVQRSSLHRPTSVVKSKHSTHFSTRLAILKRFRTWSHQPRRLLELHFNDHDRNSQAT